MEQKKLQLGLIGFPLGHSGSPAWFADKFRREGITGATYRLFPLASVEEFPSLLLANPDLAGLNVTIPFKQKIIPFLDELDETARVVGAVNTLKITHTDGAVHLKGFNTDAPGFLQTVTGLNIRGPALILGTGGGARAVAHALTGMNIPCHFVSRTTTGSAIMSYNDITPDVINDHHLIINTTPLGMFPDLHQAPPIPYQLLTAEHVLYDLVYNPAETEFLKRGKRMHASAMNGLQMLINQAELSFDIFAGTS